MNIWSASTETTTYFVNGSGPQSLVTYYSPLTCISEISYISSSHQSSRRVGRQGSLEKKKKNYYLGMSLYNSQTPCPVRLLGIRPEEVLVFCLDGISLTAVHAVGIGGAPVQRLAIGGRGFPLRYRARRRRSSRRHRYEISRPEHGVEGRWWRTVNEALCVQPKCEIEKRQQQTNSEALLSRRRRQYLLRGLGGAGRFPVRSNQAGPWGGWRGATQGFSGGGAGPLSF